MAARGLVRREAPQRLNRWLNPAVSGTAEVVVIPHSRLVGQTLEAVGIRKAFRLSPLALFRQGRVHHREMWDLPLRSGDALLLHGTWEDHQRLERSHRNFVHTSAIDVEIQKPEKLGVGVVVLGVTLAAMIVSSFAFHSRPYNPMPLSVCLMGGALLMVLTRVLDIRQAYQAVDWRTVFLLGGLIPLGMAVDRSGTAEWIATGVVGALGQNVGPAVLLTVLALMSGLFCLVISNVGACTLLVPLGVSMALQIGIDPRVAAIVVGLGVSNSFLLPTHQVNALYMGPGGYRTRDYLRVGGGMSLLYVAVLVTMTLLFYA